MFIGFPGAPGRGFSFSAAEKSLSRHAGKFDVVLCRFRFVGFELLGQPQRNIMGGTRFVIVRVRFALSGWHAAITAVYRRGVAYCRVSVDATVAIRAVPGC